MTTELDLDALRVALRADLALLLTTTDVRGGLRVVARAGAPAAHLPDEVLAPEGSLLARVLAGTHPARLPRLALLSAGAPGRSRRLGPAIVLTAEDPAAGGAVVVLARRLPRRAFDDADVQRARVLLAAARPRPMTHAQAPLTPASARRTTPATHAQAPLTPAPARAAPMTPAPVAPAQAMGGPLRGAGPIGPAAAAHRAPGSALAGLKPFGGGSATNGSGPEGEAATLDALGGTLFRSAFELAPMGMALVDEGLRYRWVNAALCAMLGRERQDLLSLTAADVVHPEHAERLAAFFDRVRAGEAAAVRERLRFRLPDGTRMWADIGGSMVPDVAGAPLYLVQQCDMTAEQDQSEELTYRAMHDDLTGLANRALLRERLHGVLARRRGSRAVAFYLDVDRFKRINDRHGHTGGDEVLRETARRLAEVVRDGDTVARVGGDEFVVAGEVATPVEAAQIAERIAAALRPPYDVGGVPLTVTVSVGVALSVPSDAPDDLVARADSALLVAKRHPRPRLVRLDPPAAEPPADAPLDLVVDGSPVRPG